MPFPIGVYSGQHKPEDFNDLLRKFVDELKFLDGKIVIGSKTLLIENIRFILDLPARCGISKIKFLGYHGCPSCEIKGTIVKTKVYYPFEKDVPLRTDYSFSQKTDHLHHLPNQISILEELNIGMISSFPLDTMHTIDEGVASKILSLIKNNRRLLNETQEDYSIINQTLKRALQTQPREFSRRIRTLDSLAFWKATENRTFLLFTGPLIMKIFDDEQRRGVYNNFLKLSVACRICSYEGFGHFLDIAEKLFNDFVDQFTDIYGVNNTTWKIHAARHMVDEVRRNGLFHEFSAYEFESFMNTIKRSLHNHTLPLQQLHRRTVEIYKSEQMFPNSKRIQDKGLIFGKQLKNQVQHELSYVWFNGTFFCANKKDCWFMTKKKEIIRVSKVIRSIQGSFRLSASMLLSKQELFLLPMPSSYIDIFQGNISRMSVEQSYEIYDIKCKIFSIQMEKNSQNYAFLPMSNIKFS